MERGLAANTVESYRRDLHRYSSVLAGRGKTGLGDITPADVAEFLASLREGDAEHAALAVSSAARAVIAVRGLHAFAVAQGLADTDPAREVPPPSPPRRLPKAITLAEVERLLDAAGPGPDDVSADPRLLRDRALLEFLYGTGARISEATGLDIDELQLGADPVVRLIGKGSKHRVVPVGSYAARALEAYLVRARPGLAAASRRVSVQPGGVPQRPRRSPHPAGRLGRAARRGRPSQPGPERVTAHAAPLVRHAHARRRCRHQGGPGTARPRVGHHHPGLHPDHGGPPPRGLRLLHPRALG